MRKSKKNNKKKIIIISVVIAVVLLAIGLIITCVAINKKKGKTNENTTYTEAEAKKIKIVDVNSNTRPYAVMINNIAVARSVQSGLSEAYIVYELLAEGGITRYLALFKDANPERIGSVRSSRHYYLDYVLENDAIYVHWGWSEQAKEDIKTLKINNINGLTYEGTYFYRYNPNGIPVEHTGFTDVEKIKSAVENLKYRDTTDNGLLLKYSADSLEFNEDAQNAESVKVVFSNYTQNLYTYDEDTKMYNKKVSGSIIKDMNTGEALEIKNIIVYDVNYSDIPNDSKGRQNLENIGKGEGYYISEGKAVKIKWSKDKRESKTKYTLENGNELVVNDGNTFIQIIPKSGSVVFE